MTTFSVMQARIADDIVRDDLAAQIRNAINDAIDLQGGERYNFNERQYLLMTVADQEYYPLFFSDDPDLPGIIPLDTFDMGDLNNGVVGDAVIEIDTITATVNQSPYPLCPRTQQWFAEQWASATYRGQPASYGRYAGDLRIYPVPDGVYRIDISGLGQLGPVPLVNDGDTNDWMTAGAMIVRAQAKILIYRDLLRDPEGVALATDQLIRAGGNPDPGSAKRKMAAQAYTGRMKAWNL